MNHEQSGRFSAAARARMERDLPALRTCVSRAPFRRRFRQAMGALACVGLLLVAARVLPGPGAVPRRDAPAAHLAAEVVERPAPVRLVAARGVIQIVAPSSPRKTRMLDDEELLRTLAAAGRADGLVRVKGRTTLASELLSVHAEVTAPRLP
jgi:hypothetical protein